MRPRFPIAAGALLATVLLTSGCADGGKAAVCAEAPKAIGDAVNRIGAAVHDPETMRKEIESGAAKLEDLANKAADTTLREALHGLSDGLRKLDVDDAKAAVEAARRVASDGADHLRQITEACL